MRTIGYVLLGFAALSAALFSTLDDATVARYGPGAFALCLGAALLTWGAGEMQEGRIRGRNVHVYRDERPTTFHALLAGKRLLPGIIMVLAGFWYAFLR